jgi:hypothetical protein
VRTALRTTHWTKSVRQARMRIGRRYLAIDENDGGRHPSVQPVDGIVRYDEGGYSSATAGTTATSGPCGTRSGTAWVLRRCRTTRSMFEKASLAVNPSARGRPYGTLALARDAKTRRCMRRGRTVPSNARCAGLWDSRPLIWVLRVHYGRCHHCAPCLQSTGRSVVDGSPNPARSGFPPARPAAICP